LGVLKEGEGMIKDALLAALMLAVGGCLTLTGLFGTLYNLGEIPSELEYRRRNMVLIRILKAIGCAFVTVLPTAMYITWCMYQGA
jgi:hypothetical protein